MPSAMIKVRAEEQALLIWNAQQARTAYISGAELDALERWTENIPGGFTERLKKLGLICDEDLPAIKAAIAAAKTQTAPPNSFCAPESLHIELTSHCPLDCPQCYKNRKDGDLSFTLLLDVIKQAGQMKVFQIALGGGEPLGYPHLLSAIGAIRQYGMAVSITTSGFGLTQDRLACLQEAGLDHMQVSLNGSQEEIHSRSRQGFGDAIKALKLLKNSQYSADRGLSFGINWVARADNIDDLPRLIAMAKEYQAHNINILRYKPSPRETYTDVCLSDEKLILLANVIQHTKGIPLKTDSAFSGLLCHINQGVSFFSGCGAGRRFLALDAAGHYRPCSHVNRMETSNSLAQVWYHSDHLALFRSIGEKISAPCNTCGFMSGCYGCRAVLEGQGQDFFAGEQACIFYS